MINEYEITIKNEKLYVKNYIKIMTVNKEKIIIKMKENIINIIGDNLLLVKMDKYDLLIIGNVKRIEFNNEW